MSLKFGGVRQVGYVVRDIEKAMLHWATVLGVGPWFYREDVDSIAYNYYGKPSRLPKLSIALANSGDMQVELIQQRCDAPSLYLDTLAKSGEIAQHVAYWTDDQFDDWCASLLAHGYVEGHSGRMGQRGRYAYFVHSDLPSGMIEISEMRGGKGEYFAKVREAARIWDGTDPIRPVGRPK